MINQFHEKLSQEQAQLNLIEPNIQQNLPKLTNHQPELKQVQQSQPQLKNVQSPSLQEKSVKKDFKRNINVENAEAEKVGRDL